MVEEGQGKRNSNNSVPFNVDSTLQSLSVPSQSVPLLLAAAGWRGAEEMGLGAAGAQRGLALPRSPASRGRVGPWPEAERLLSRRVPPCP